jgi:hypothetical protein
LLIIGSQILEREFNLNNHSIEINPHFQYFDSLK